MNHMTIAGLVSAHLNSPDSAESVVEEGESAPRIRCKD